MNSITQPSNTSSIIL